MKIYFAEAEVSEEGFFASELSGHDVHFVDTLAEVGAEAEVLSTFIYSQVDASFLDGHQALKLIITRSTGHDHISLDECRKRGIVVSNVQTYGDNTVAEHAFALILACSRRIRESLDFNRDQKFSYGAIRGFDLKHKTLGVIGSGRIGLHVIRMAKAFDMTVIAYDPQPQQFLAEVLGFDYVPIEELLRRSEIITLHAPLTAATHHILNREAFAKCKRGVVVVNTARGGLIDTDALIEALASGVVGGAGLDVLEDERVLQKEASAIISDQIIDRLQSGVSSDEVHEHRRDRIEELQRLVRNNELIARSNVVFTPHIAFNSVEAVERINRTVVQNIQSFIAGTPTNVIT